LDEWLIASVGQSLSAGRSLGVGSCCRMAFVPPIPAPRVASLLRNSAISSPPKRFFKRSVGTTPSCARTPHSNGPSLPSKVGAGILALVLLVHSPVLSIAPAHSVGAPILDREHELVEEVWALVRSYFVDPKMHGIDWDAAHNRLMSQRLRSRTETYQTLRATLSELGDPYTRIIDTAGMERLRKYDVSGVGLLLTGNSKGELVVASDPLKSSAAGRFGLARGVIITSIDGAPLQGLGGFQAAQLMQGEEGSLMRVGVLDADGSNPREITLKRSYAESGGAPVVSALDNVGDRKVGYVKLADFSAGSRLAVESALRDLDARGASAYVLDLRGNPGGVFEGALEIAGLFEGRDALVARVASRAQSDEIFRSRLAGEVSASRNGIAQARAATPARGTYLGGAVVSPEAPLAVLVDGGSASSSEVLAGSLQDNCRGAIAGRGHSYGKGLIQGVFGLSDGGGVIITVASYRTPAGNEIQGKGVTATAAFSDSLMDKITRAFRKQGPAAGIDFSDVESRLKVCKAEDRLAKETRIFPATRFGI
jgi:carboxyl-terminal processing protease